jgi:DMSO/TMAO reductase YedYZ molybdopterin-dependent catalytic subunit
VSEPIVISQRPLNVEAPLSALGAEVTAAGDFYVRNHFDVPSIAAEDFRLEITGHVDREVAFSLEELRAMPTRTVRVTLECAGNGRTDVTPQPKGTPWGRGAVSTGDFTGTPLADVLGRAGVRSGASEVEFVGADSGPVGTGGTEAYARSLDLAGALEDAPLLVWSLNGAPLSPERGFPLRLLVPGWYGMASVKWLTRIVVRTSPFGGFYQAVDYTFQDRVGTEDGTPVTLMEPESLVLSPAGGTTVQAGTPIAVQGIAWSGRGPVSQLEVRVDDGPWHEATLGAAGSRFAHRSWTWTWPAPAAGMHRLTARATDESGRTQPLKTIWNRLGYVNNGCHTVGVMVA